MGFINSFYKNNMKKNDLLNHETIKQASFPGEREREGMGEIRLVKECVCQQESKHMCMYAQECVPE